MTILRALSKDLDIDLTPRLVTAAFFAAAILVIAAYVFVVAYVLLGTPE